MESEESRSKAEPDLEWSVFFRHGDIAASHGQLREAGDFFEEARQVGQRLQVKSVEAFAVAERGRVQALVGNRKEAMESANTSLEIFQDYNQKLVAGEVLAFTGENKKALDQAGLSVEDIACVIPHQANLRIMEAIADRLGISRDKMFVNLDRYGNTSAAAVAIALDEANRTGRIKRGDYVLMVVFGGGLTWASTVIEW